MAVSDVIDQLGQIDPRELPLVPREPGCPVPVLPIQLSVLKWMKESKKSESLRFCTIGLRLLGPLDVPLLNRSIAEVVARHEALRTKIVEAEGVFRQHIEQPLDHYLDVVDLQQVPPSLREEEVRKRAHEFAEEKIDLFVGPLFAAKLFKIADEEHVLIVAVDHIVIDGASMGILNREIWTVYHRAMQGLPASLPKLCVQYGDYAVWLQKTLGAWQKEHEPYWRERLSAAPCLKLPIDNCPEMNAGSRLDFSFGKPLTGKLRRMATRQGTLLPIVVFAIYISVMSRWYEKSDLLAWFVYNGRHRPELRSIIGFVAYGLNLRIEICNDDTFLDLLKRVNLEFWLAHEHRDFGWVPHTIAAPTTDLSFNWGPGWVFGKVYGAIDGSGIRIQPFPLRKNFPGCGFASGGFGETSGEIVMYVFYDPKVISPSVMKSLRDQFVSAANELAEHSRAPMAPLLRKVSTFDPNRQVKAS